MYAIPIICSEDLVTSAAFLSSNKNKIAIHLVNKGATRNATITGIPKRINELKIYITNKEKSFESYKTVPVRNGIVSIELERASFISLMSK